MIEIKTKNARPKLWLAMTVVLAALAGMHFLDARAGVLESGDTWLLGRYLAVAAIGIGGSVLLGWMLLWGPKSGRRWGTAPEKTAAGEGKREERVLIRRGCPVEKVFLVSSLLFGMLSLYVLPALSAPDEVRHYISAYQLSNRIMGLPAVGEDGKVPVREEDWFAEDSCRDFKPYVTADGALATDAEGAEDAKVLGQMLTEETYGLLHEKGLTWDEPRTGTVGTAEEGTTEEGTAEATGVGNGIAYSNHHPVVTTPVAYLAPALGITLARLLDLNSVGLLFLGRFFNLLLFVGMTYLALRKLPFGKEVLYGVTLLPMVVHLSASYSYDVLIMAGIFYFTAYCLYLAYAADRVRPVDILILAVLMAAVGPCKMVYTVFMGLCLLIPVKKFGNWGKWALAAGCVLGAWAIVMVVINGQTVASYATETENFIDWAQEPGFSMALLIHQPVRTLQIFYNTLIWQAETYHLTMLGAYLGNVDLVLDVPYIVLLFFTFGLIGLTLRKPGENLMLTGGKRWWIWFLCLLCAGATCASMLLAWTPISSRTISGVQGRYFLPFLPVLLMTWKNDLVVLTKDPSRTILYLMCCGQSFVWFRLFAIVCMRL